MKYLVTDTYQDITEEFDSGSDAAYYICNNADMDDMYNEALDDSYGNVKICGYDYESSHALKRLDPVAYSTGLYEYTDSVARDMSVDIERMNHGDTDEWFNFTVECIEMELVDNPYFEFYYEKTRDEITIYDSNQEYLDSWGISPVTLKDDPNFYDNLINQLSTYETVADLLNGWMFDGKIVDNETDATNEIRTADGQTVYILAN